MERVGQQASCLTTFKLALKTTTLLAFVPTKHCSDIFLLCINIQHLFFSIMLLFSFLYLVARWIDWVHLPPQINVGFHSNVDLCPVFILRLI